MRNFLVFSFLFALFTFLAPDIARADADVPSPPPPRVQAGAWLLLDHDSGQVLAEHDADKPFAPASLTKLMTAYLLFERLEAGHVRLGDPVRISPRAAAAVGARLFLRHQSEVAVEDLMKGMIVRSANDATMALAEHLAGSEAAFVAEMNRKAQTLGLTRTRFVNATGLDAEGHVSTARDATRLASALIRDFPRHYGLFAVREFSFNDIRQYNRNALLWRDASVDGVKTGHTRAAGYCLIASARRDGMRLIATVLGAPDEERRIKASQRLLEFGFGHFETRLLYAANVPATKVRVWMGEADVLPLGVSDNLYLTLPRGWHERLRARLTIQDLQMAPIRIGQRIGTLALDLDQRRLAEYPLVALAEIGRGNIVQRAFDQVRLWLR